jgi:hypothetical protein
MEDLIMIGIQVLCVCLLVGCGAALLSKHLCGPEGCGSILSYSKNQRKHGHFDLHPLPPSPLYTIPNSMNHIGDKSDAYAALRKDFDQRVLPRMERKLSLTPMEMKDTGHQVAYDVYNCPDHPPDGYPYEWKLVNVLDHWPPDDPNPPPTNQLHQGLCVFDYIKEHDKALRYRKAEVPFVVRNDPQVAETAARWNAPHYMEQLMGHVQHRAEYSDTNHFLYWNAPPKHHKNTPPDQAHKPAHPKPKYFKEMHPPADWKEPTKMMRMTYSEWFAHANVTDEQTTALDPHWYFRLIGCGETGPEGQCDSGSSEYLFDELPYFQPKRIATDGKPSLYIVDPDQQKGIHCRFGMRGVIAENHFDGSRNAIVVLGGERRYILSHPKECPHLALLPKDHPSARHSAVDWSQPDLLKHPEFELAQGNEVVLQAGDVLYLPTNWFHYIVSLSTNFQCNTRSGITHEYMPPIKECGF